MEISTGESAARGLPRGLRPECFPSVRAPPGAPSSGTRHRVTGAAPAASRALTGAIGASKQLRTDTGRSWRRFPRAGSLIGTAGCPCARGAPHPAAQAARTRPAGFPEGGWLVPGARPALAARFVPRCRSRAAARSPGTSRPRCGGCPQVGAGSPAASGPSPADGAAGAPCPGLRGPDGLHLARLSPPAVSPPSPGRQRHRGRQRPAWPGRRGNRDGPRRPRAKVRVTCPGGRRLLAGVRGLPGKRLLTERMSDSDGYSLRLPGL